ncbi:hypothetical protein [Paenibacillus xanthanilyticus]|uniref:Uncharacterized protein n=1 Tax=Paenibacillus xanthanilyticus TaxID=1783531 RepID=A0ABV8K904_9BACL
MIGTIFLGTLGLFLIAIVALMIRTKRLVYWWFCMQGVLFFLSLYSFYSCHQNEVQTWRTGIRPAVDPDVLLGMAVLFGAASLWFCFLGVVFLTYYRQPLR